MDTWILPFFEWCKILIICLWRSEQRHCHHSNGQYKGERHKEKKKVPTEERESLRTNISWNLLGVHWFKVVYGGFFLICTVEKKGKKKSAATVGLTETKDTTTNTETVIQIQHYRQWTPFIDGPEFSQSLSGHLKFAAQSQFDYTTFRQAFL